LQLASPKTRWSRGSFQRRTTGCCRIGSVLFFYPFNPLPLSWPAAPDPLPHRVTFVPPPHVRRPCPGVSHPSASPTPQPWSAYPLPATFVLSLPSLRYHVFLPVPLFPSHKPGPGQFWHDPLLFWLLPPTCPGQFGALPGRAPVGNPPSSNDLEEPQEHVWRIRSSSGRIFHLYEPRCVLDEPVLFGSPRVHSTG